MPLLPWLVLVLVLSPPAPPSVGLQLGSSATAASGLTGLRGLKGPCAALRATAEAAPFSVQYVVLDGKDEEDGVQEVKLLAGSPNVGLWVR